MKVNERETNKRERQKGREREGETETVRKGGERDRKRA